ncbi:TIGR03546 family protein [Candidatus Nitronereus thalassa]|uniref:TIGR03546 family protein n=1 Tax=Candidatus Nitronereus thalassa TaxID=3020898 RepID=A0ABU3K4Q5_9BACT|nr:TIGR03546 family protein [Candidatus Nitronereus thalassa]MDT7041333.1 TIGR03546 family protein [Candidatus Nitronereus thalassa]
MLRLIARLLRVLNSETNPGQVSLGFCFAMVAGFTPLWNVHNLVVLLLVLILRVNLSAFLIGLAVFSGFAFLLDPVFHWNGMQMLNAPSLEGLWTSLYNSTPWRFTRFNNTVVIGSLVFSLALFFPLYFLSNVLILRYRAHVLAWVEKTRLMQFFKASKVYQMYQSLPQFGGH